MPRRSAALCRRLLPWLVLALLAACSSLPGLGDKADGAAAEGPPVLQLEVRAPDALAALLQKNLDLGRVNRLARGEPLQEGELDRLLAAAAAQVRGLLDTEGWFNAEIRVERLPQPTPDALPVVRISVEPGPRTQVGRVDLRITGPLAAASAAAPPPRAMPDEPVLARQAEQALRAGWPLPEGSAFRDADWSRAKTAGIAALRAQGYVQAEWTSTRATVDAATQRAELAATAASGPLFRVGPLRVRGLRVQDEATVAHIANLQPGAPATEVMLLDIQERLQKSDLFDRATVSLALQPPVPEATPVAVRLGERKLQEATLGVGVGANVGTRVTLKHVHRRPFGRPWVARNDFDIAQRRQRWDGELSTQTLPRLYRNLLGGALERVESDTDTVDSAQLRVGRAQDTRRISRLLFVQWDHSATTSALGRARADALALHVHGVWRALDDPLLPTRGRAWTGQVGVGHARSEPGGQGLFTRLYARLDAYHPLGRTWYGQGRLEAGQIFAPGGVLAPEALRFRAGGDESVRGYAYRSLTRRVDGVEVGSEVLLTASLEVARPILARLPALWGAIFVDLGRAAGSWRELDPALGYGVGLRYRSPVGPVKLDLAWGQEVRRLRLHLSVGLAF